MSYSDVIEHTKKLALDNPRETFWVLTDLSILTDEEMDIEAGINFPNSTPLAASVTLYPADVNYQATFELEEWEVLNVQTH